MKFQIYTRIDKDTYVKNLAPFETTTNKDEATVCEYDGSADFTDLEEWIGDYFTEVESLVGSTFWFDLYIEGVSTKVMTCAFTATHAGFDIASGIGLTWVPVLSKLGKITMSAFDVALFTHNAKAAMGTLGTPTASSTTSAAAPVAKDATGDVEKLIEAINEKTKATVSKPSETLADYICEKELMDEFLDVKDFFERFDEYTTKGIALPKGILLKGYPGTGKTYAAKCIAGSTDCYFMSTTASALQGMYVGSGAENIRNIFKGANELVKVSGKGVILFIDEIDSFGNRDNHGSGAGSEEDRTVNQLLAEMSGFEDVTKIMVLAATNYPDRLDDAMLRSGRFSKQINIPVPDFKGRKAQLEFYLNKIKMPLNGIDVMDLAAYTEGFTPADIAECVNEAAILAVREKASELAVTHFDEAINRTLTHNIRNADKGSMKDMVAVHECGHVLAEWMFKHTYSIKVTSYSYGDAGGFTQSARPDNTITTQDMYLGDIYVLLGGRAAEEVVLGEVSTGASSDLARAVSKIRHYYSTYHFEKYEAKELEQTVEDKLHDMYENLLTEMRRPEHRVVLDKLITELKAKRVLYTQDIFNITEA